MNSSIYKIYFNINSVRFSEYIISYEVVYTTSISIKYILEIYGYVALPSFNTFNNGVGEVFIDISYNINNYSFIKYKSMLIKYLRNENINKILE